MKKRDRFNRKNEDDKVKRIWVSPDSFTGGFRIVKKRPVFKKVDIEKSCVFCKHAMIAGINVVCLSTTNNLGIVKADGESCYDFEKAI